MNYMIEYRNEQVVKYASSNYSPVCFFSHLLFTNGNGIEFENGNIVDYWTNDRKIRIEDIYKTKISLDQIKENYNDSPEREEYLDDLFKQKSKINNYCGGDKTDDELWHEIIKSESKATFMIKTLTTEQVENKDFWLRELIAMKQTEIRISKDFAGIFKINENTLPELFNIALAFVNAFVKYYTLYSDDNEFISKDLDILLTEQCRLDAIKNKKLFNKGEY